MLRHMLKLIWKRKTRNMMLSLEILLAFAVVFAIAAFASRSMQLYRMPLGFDYADVWSVTIQVENDSTLKDAPTIYDSFKRNLSAMSEVEQVAFATFQPFRSGRITDGYAHLDGSGEVVSEALEVSDEFFKLLGVHVETGRAFDVSDDGTSTVPTVINRKLAHSLFPGQSAIGKQFTNGEPSDTKRSIMRVTGVIDDYRGQGDFKVPTNMAFTRFLPLSTDTRVKTMLIKLKPGTSRAFEARLNARLKLVRNDWTYKIEPLVEQRAGMLRSSLTPLVIGAVIAAFLLLMVGFGLFGVLWQNTTQRIPEIGLRRAIGADSGHIYRQIIGEQMLLSSLAMGVALLLLVQLPLTGALGSALNWAVFLQATALSMALIYLISLLCALYPGWRASQLSPTEALHYE